jgi:hypothetical protein
VKRTAELKKATDMYSFSRPFHGLHLDILALPSDESLGYSHPSANAD